jgi:hypothetical protein
VQRKHVLLRLALERYVNRIDGRATASQMASASRASFLTRLHVRAHEARTHKLHFKHQLCDLVCPVVRSSAGLHSHHAGRQLRHER